MAETLQVLQARRDELQRLVDQGASRVQRGMNSTELRSLQDMQTILADLDARIAALDGASPPPVKRIYATGGKGL